ncbi:acyl-CoA dehydrogenase [Streptoalloteichus tenebrarius]|uniref:Acyl-CoA dehydrogenase n=1 Tax=Streptoalloteichus tenebrarius (strain ATCC 17920 / DSM 40477 / JCM 4838 / CBS 697.72 / NBRC 16177 / NCIMB 11028 / NRRL B-12390 / A12253. 1 / ISP 5477) TaxID=1933 RepID=A0ABT1HRN8_STRSD|nr:acyl-CoA dehydrogenase family protein [Streptoalloteichus tenebrarius]MCP2258143.1 acyl-CoA dehydrogenase [Streptoalloteichus tenebrarius]BFF04630.1 hypothetical protein GCM10020241_63050 [Streptoalloteichus tenebrarius]
MSPAPDRTALDAATDEVAALAAEHAAEVDERAEFPTAAVAAMRRTGLLGLMVPVEYSGLGGDLRDLVRVVGRIAGGCLSTGLVLAMHCQQVETIARHAGAALRARLLPEVAEGRRYLASVTTEDGSGGHLFQGSASLERTGEGWTLRRAAPIVTGGRRADGFLVKAVDAGTPPRTRLCYVDRERVSVGYGQTWRAMGMRGTENTALTLTGRVPDDQMLGETEDSTAFREIALETFAPSAHLGWSAAWLGAARAAFAALVRLARRGDPAVRFDRKSDLDVHRLAGVRTRLEVVAGYLSGVVDEVLTLRSLGRTLDRPATQIRLNTLKVIAARETLAAAEEMMTIAGLRTGYLRDAPVPLERLVRDLHSASLNYDDRRLLAANGALCLLDTAVTLPGDQ